MALLPPASPHPPPLQHHLRRVHPRARPRQVLLYYSACDPLMPTRVSSRDNDAKLKAIVAAIFADELLTSNATRPVVLPFGAGCNLESPVAANWRRVCYDLVESVGPVWEHCRYGKPGRASSCSRSGAPCSGHGVCFFGRCLCSPGHAGTRCADVLRGDSPACIPGGPRQRRYVDHADACLRNPAYGSAVIPARRWRNAQKAEAELWRRAGNVGESRLRQLMRKNLDNFDFYRALQSNTSLGHIAEVGAGLWTQTLFMLRARPDASAESVTLIDPGIEGYLATGVATFQKGTLRGAPVYLMPIGAERVPACFTSTYDTVVMINVIEHTFNAFATLHTAYRLLKPGGLFVFAERVVRMDSFDQIFHPVRLTTGFYNEFLGQLYRELYRFNGRTHEMRHKVYIENEVVFIGRKLAPER